MAPQVGLEPTTDRLTADSSTTELLRNNNITAWQRPTLTGTRVPTTIGAEKLNFRVRYGNGCDLLALITRLFVGHYFIIMSFSYFSRENFIFFIPSKLDNAEEVVNMSFALNIVELRLLTSVEVDQSPSLFILVKSSND
jgi:hypothetical protein